MSTIPQGWQCPACKVIHAPSVTECACVAVQPMIRPKPCGDHVHATTHGESVPEWQHDYGFGAQ